MTKRTGTFRLMSNQRRALDLNPEEFRVLVRDAVCWGVVMASLIIGLAWGLLAVLLRVLRYT